MLAHSHTEKKLPESCHICEAKHFTYQTEATLYPPCQLKNHRHIATSSDDLIKILGNSTNDRMFALLYSVQTTETNNNTCDNSAYTNSILYTINSPFVPLDVSIAGPLRVKNRRSLMYVIATCGVGGILLYPFELTKDRFSNSIVNDNTMPPELHFSEAILNDKSTTCKVVFSSYTGFNECFLASASTGGTISIWDICALLTNDRDEKNELSSQTNLKAIWENEYKCSQVTCLSFSSTNTFLAFTCRSGDIYLIEKNKNIFLHSTIIKDIMGETSNKTNSFTSIGPSLVTWMMSSNEEDVLVGINGPTQNWVVLYPKNGFRCWKDIKLLNSVHGHLDNKCDNKESSCMEPDNVVKQLLLIGDGNGFISITQSETCRLFLLQQQRKGASKISKENQELEEAKQIDV
jgi:hypothetical protein